MFGKLAAYHLKSDYDFLDRSTASIGSCVLGFATALIGVIYLNDQCHWSNKLLIDIYAFVLIILFVSSGFAKYDSDSDRKWTLGSILFWPATIVGLLIYWTIYPVVALLGLLYKMHGNISNVKMPKFPKRKIALLKKEKIPGAGTYRSAPETCNACGHFLDHEIHK